MNTRFKNYTGLKFGKLEAIKFMYRENNVTYWLFKCDCGREEVIDMGNVKAGNRTTCGCSRLPR